MGVLRTLVPEMEPDVRLVRRLVLREACVAVDAKERPAARARVRAEVGADLLEARRELADEGERRLEQVLLVSTLVGREPLAVVVRPQILEEREELGAERLLFRGLRHGLLL